MAARPPGPLGDPGPEINCVDLKQRLGDRYRIIHDEAAKDEPGGLKDPWYCVIPCKFGEIYPYGGELLAFHCTSSVIRGKVLRAYLDKVDVQNWTDDGEAVLLFHVELFHEIAKLARPRRKKQLSENHLRRLKTAGTEALKRHRLATLAGVSGTDSKGLLGKPAPKVPGREKVGI